MAVTYLILLASYIWSHLLLVQTFHCISNAQIVHLYVVARLQSNRSILFKSVWLIYLSIQGSRLATCCVSGATNKNQKVWSLNTTFASFSGLKSWSHQNSKRQFHNYGNMTDWRGVVTITLRQINYLSCPEFVKKVSFIGETLWIHPTRSRLNNQLCALHTNTHDRKYSQNVWEKHSIFFSHSQIAN